MGDAFPLSGQIDPKSFPFLLTRLHLQGATGSLKVEGPSYQKALYFRGGRILFGSSNDPRDQLGAILIEAGRITPEQLEDVNTKVGPGNPLAKVLADTGYVSQRELSEAARAKVERILSDLIAYTAGNFEFEDGVLPKGAVDLKLSTPRVIVAAVRRVADRSFVLRHLDLETVLSPTADLTEHLQEVAADTAGLVDQLDGRRTLKDAAASTSTRLDEFEAAKIGAALLFLGYAEKAATPAAGVDVGEVDLGQGAVAPFSFDDDEPAPQTESMAVPDLGTDATQMLSSPPRFDLEEPPADADAEPPLFPPAEDAPDFQIADPAAFAPAPEPFVPAPEAEEPIVADEGEVDAGPSLDATVMLGQAPAFSIGEEEPAAETIQMRASEDTVPVPEPEPAPEEPPPTVVPPPRAARPSKDDLAALDAILHPEKAKSAASEAPTARQTVQRPPSPRRAAPAPSRRPLVLGLVAATLLVVGAGAVWFLMLPEPAHRPLTTPPPPTTVAMAPSAPPATPGMGAVMPVPMPVPSGAAPGTVAPAPTTMAAATPAPPPTTQRPAATPPPAPSGGLDGARAALRSGRLDEAARGFGAAVRNAPAGSATLQLLVACSAETVQKAVSGTGGGDMIVTPVDLKGRSCYRVSWGLYPSAGAANAALGSVPAYFRNEGVKPRVVAATELSR